MSHKTWVLFWVLSGSALVVAWNETSATESLWTWYLQGLDSAPLLTKSVTTAFIQILGDFLAQCLEIRMDKQVGSWKESIVAKYDLRRGLSLFADGIFLSGPLMHYAYDTMEVLLPSQESALAALLHVVVNDVLLDALYLAISFYFVALAEGHVLRDLPSLIPTIKASWATSLFLFPVEFCCFRLLGVHWRVLCMNFIDVLWGAIISFVSHAGRPKPSEKLD